MSHKGIGKNPERITKLKYFVNKYNWKGINYPLEKDDWKNLLEKYVSKHNSNREKQAILLMISNRGEWHYIAVKNYGDLYCSIVFIILEQKINLNRIKMYVKTQIFVI